MTESVNPPRLLVCDLDLGLLGNRAAEARLLDAWMAWDPASRPLLLFMSQLPLDDLQPALLATNLPPAEFLLDARTSLLIRFAFRDSHPSAASADTDRLLSAMVSQALWECQLDKAPLSARPPALVRLTQAALTTSGLVATFEPAMRQRRPSASLVLAWLLEHLALGPESVRNYQPDAAPTPQKSARVVKMRR